MWSLCVLLVQAWVFPRILPQPIIKLLGVIGVHPGAPYHGGLWVAEFQTFHLTWVLECTQTQRVSEHLTIHRHAHAGVAS